MEDNDAQLQVKKRARRRLVGAVFFASVVAVVLPMVMDQEPRPPVQDVEIRIPGQDEKPFAPKFASAPVEAPPEAVPAPKAPEPPAAPEKVAVPAEAPARPVARVVEASAEKRPDKAADKAVAKAAEKPAEKAAEKPQDRKTADKPQEKPAAKPAEKPADKAKADEARRAAALLAGAPAADVKPAARGGEFLVLIGAFASDDNVRNLKAKLGEQGIKTFSEPLDTPQGKKTRVRAGPFPSREAAEKALDKMKKIGVSGVVAAKP